MKIIFALIVILFMSSSHSATLYLTRHYEKADGADPSLTAKGQARAQQLAAMLADKPIAAIYTTDYKRTRETVAPLSEALSLDVITYDPNKLKAFARMLKKNNTVAVIAGHSNTTPELIRYLGGPTFSIGEQDYGTLFILEFTNDKTTVTLQRVSSQ